MKYTAVVGILTTLTMITACGRGSAASVALEGHVILATGSSILRVSLDGFGHEQLWMAPSAHRVASLVPVDRNSALFSTDWFEDSAVYVFEVSEKRVRCLRRGTMACYLAEDEMILFYNRDENGGKFALCGAALCSVNDASRIENAPEPIMLEDGTPLDVMVPPVAINAHEAIFVGENRELKVYDSRTNRVSETALTNLLPEVYRAETNGLICFDYSTWSTVEVNLDDMGLAQIKGLSGGGHYIYLPNVDMLLYSKLAGEVFPVSREKYEMCVFDLRGEKEIVVGGGHVGRGYWCGP